MLKLRRLLVSLLAGIGALTLLIVLLVWLSATLISDPERSEFNLHAELMSPDQTFRAAHYQGMGGGAAGWCKEVVTVQRREKLHAVSRLPPHKEDGMDFMDGKVFTVSCGSQLRMAWASGAGEGAQHLQISFTLGGKTGGVSTYMRAQNSDGRVRVSYSVSP